MHAQRHEGNKYIQSCALRDLYFLLYILSHEGFFSASRIKYTFFSYCELLLQKQRFFVIG